MKTKLLIYVPVFIDDTKMLFLNFFCSLAKTDIVLTTFNLVACNVGVTEDMKKNKAKQNMAAEDQVY